MGFGSVHARIQIIRGFALTCFRYHHQQQVLTNKDLDLPTQQELLAQFRCDEIAAVVLEQFEAASKGVRKPVETGSVLDGLGGMMGDWRSTAMSQSRWLHFSF